MAYMVIRHKVKDYDAWKVGFDNAIDIRKAGGEKSFRIFQLVDDRNDVVAIFEWDSLDNAKKFVDSPELREAMEKAGVSEEPKVNFLEEVAQGTT
ncbi:MAG: antibiotic biosynthesis monooxygenase [Candidatus Zixiibacteriota bacterium]|nr:MAG: antibiotic biosynthesis monooxygenase [candidate division Zixibacteria bacterium]